MAEIILMKTFVTIKVKGLKLSESGISEINECLWDNGKI